MKEDYPVFTIDSNKVTVDWGLAEDFESSADSTIFYMKMMKLQIKDKSIFAEDEAREVKFSQTLFTNLKTNVGDIDLRCLPWKMTVELTLEMLKFKGKNNLDNSKFEPQYFRRKRS